LTLTVTTERRVRGAGLSLSVTERGLGAGPTVVLVHGFPDTSAVWIPVAERLASDHHVVSYDVRGAGSSDEPGHRTGYALPLLVDDLVAVLDATSPDSPVHLVAHDWGSVQGWEAVTTKGVAERFASYTSISGPPLDHAGLWARQHRSMRSADLGPLLRQALHSWYIAYFLVPWLPELMVRSRRATELWASSLHRIEQVPTDDHWPAPTFSADFTHGVELYRANVRDRMRHPRAGHTDVPVQLIVPSRDRFLSPALLEGLEDWASHMWRRPADGGHWLIRTHPDDVARWVGEVVTAVESGTEPDDLRRLRVTGA
jgi:pimeloyl-ACP methyl ester carboxylesterase